MANEDYTINIKMMLGSASSSLKNLKNQTDSVTHSVTKASKAGSIFSTSMLKVGAALGGLALIRSAVQGFVSFENAIAEVNTLLPKAERSTEKFMKALSSLSSEFGRDKTTQAKAFYNIISSGITDTARALGVLRTANELSVGGLTDVNTAANGLTAVLNAYSLSADEASRVSDILFQTVINARTTIPELSESLSVVSPIASQAGVSFQELTAALGALTLSGTPTNVAAVQLRQVLTSIISPTKEAADQAKALGIEFSASSLQSKGLRQTIIDLSNATEGNSEAQSALFGNVRAFVGVAQLAKNGASEFARLLDDNLNNSLGKTQVAVEEASKSVAQQTKLMKESFSSLTDEAVKLFAPSVTDGFKQWTIFFRILRKDIDDITSYIQESSIFRKLFGEEEAAQKRQLMTEEFENELFMTEEQYARKQELQLQDALSTEAADKVEKGKELQREKDHSKAILGNLKSGNKAAIKETESFYDTWKSYVTNFSSFEKSTQKQRQDNLKSSLSAIATLTTSSNKELFFIGKAAAVAQATIDGIAAVQKAWASAPFPANAAIAALVGVATAANVAKIASSKPPAFENGGIVGGSSYSGDNVAARVNSGEMILNKSQQTELFKQANGGGGNSNMTEAIMALGDRIANLEVVLKADDIEIARSVRRAMSQGFSLT